MLVAQAEFHAKHSNGGSLKSFSTPYSRSLSATRSLKYCRYGSQSRSSSMPSTFTTAVRRSSSVQPTSWIYSGQQSLASMSESFSRSAAGLSSVSLWNLQGSHHHLAQPYWQRADTCLWRRTPCQDSLHVFKIHEMHLISGGGKR